MDKVKKFFNRKIQTYGVAIAILLLLCILVGVLCVQYYKQVQDTVKTENSGYMQEISKQMATNVGRTIKDNFAVLETLTSVLQYENVTTYDGLAPVVSELKNQWNYEKILLIYENGIVHDENGKTVIVSDKNYLRQVVMEKRPSMTPSQMVDGEESIVFAIPIKATTLEGNNVLAIAASYDLSNFDKNLSMTAFDGKGYAHIISKDGTIIIRSSSKNALPMGYNILTSISQGEMQSTRSVEDVQCQLEEEKSGQLEFSLGGVNEYMTYTPLGVEEWVLATFVPVSVVNAKSTLLLESTILLCSFITISFGLLLGFLMVLFYRHKRKLEKIAYVDPVTDGNTIQRFYDLAAIALQDAEECEYALVYTNIKKFKVLNEQFGRSACDATLRSIENAIAIDLKSPECVGHLFADNFCVLIKYGGEEEMTERFRRWHQLSSQITEKNGALWLPLILEFGVYIIDDNKVLFPHMIDRAKLALSETTVEILGKLRYAIYDERVRRLLLREKQLEDMMEEALENCEFEVYLQPKYHTKDEKIGGAEALVRWNSQTEGMIYPDEFISLFEKNGFIVPLDFWVFEQTCKALRRWIDAGFEPVKVSVNCSRIHLKNPQFLDQYCIIAEKCNVSPEYLEIELTENTVFEDVEHLTHTIERIHQAGFGCSMDDFGSGYSSLNLIQDIPVDTLKLDRIFFRDGVKNEIRTESVIASIISMAKALAMKTVAEGVERREQVDMLKRLDCDYIQGYYFAKPMPIGEFEALAFGISLDHQLPLRRTEEDS